MLTTLFNLLFGQRDYGTDLHRQKALVAKTSPRRRQVKDNPVEFVSTGSKQGLGSARSYWNHGMYRVIAEPSIQQRINMIYAPVAHSLSEDAFTPALTQPISSESGNKQVNCSPCADLCFDPEHVRNFRRPRRVNEVLEEIVLHPSDEVRIFVASSCHTPECALRALMSDSCERVRMALLNNPNCPPDVTKQLIRDTSSVVSFSAVTKIRQRWTGLGRTA